MFLELLWGFVLSALGLVSACLFLRPSPVQQKHVLLIVLGDFGRSPRMQFHTESLVRNGFFVSVVALGGNFAISTSFCDYSADR